jgi:hypothetical protein
LIKVADEVMYFDWKKFPIIKPAVIEEAKAPKAKPAENPQNRTQRQPRVPRPRQNLSKKVQS